VIGVLAAPVWLASDLSARKYLVITSERVSRKAITHALAIDMTTRTGPILADEGMGLLALLGRPLAFQPFELSALARVGVWDDTAFIERLARGDYPAIYIYNPNLHPTLRLERWTPAMLRALNTYYRPARTMGETTIYLYTGRR
jgi:hypothetical protein